MKLSPYHAAVAAGVLGLGLVALYVWKRGIGGAASDVGSAAVSAVGGVATGVVTGVSNAVGIPTPADTTTDPAVARWIIDQYGYFEASKWSGAPALFKAAFMATGSGTPPLSGSVLANYLATLPMTGTPASADPQAVPADGAGYTTNPMGDPW